MVLLPDMLKSLRLPYFLLISRTLATKPSELKSILAAKIPKEREKVRKLRETHGSAVIGEITVDKVYAGMRGLKTLVCETSIVDPDEGVRLRGYTISECQKLLPKAKGGNEPLPEGVFWLLVTGDIPTDSQVASISSEWAERAALPVHVASMVKNFPSSIHPMSQFIAAIAALNYESTFTNAYNKGVKKEVYWEYVYEDAMELIAKLPVISAKIYRNTFKEGKGSGIIDPKKDWSANFVQMMGFDNAGLTEVVRLFLTIYSGHDGGNVSTHAVHLIGSTLADPYLAFAAGVSGLAGPLHGLANQEAFMYIKTIQKELGDKATDDQVKEFVRKTLNAGLVVPGFGHEVLRITDPRYTCQRDFALKHFPKDPLFKIASQLFKVVPGILQDTGKVKNPWPNVDAHAGVLLQHYGLTEMKYYPVLIGVSRSLGAMASLIWDRALGLPIEHPSSVTTEYLRKHLKMAS